MPDRDYYTKDDDASKKLREQYVAHVTKMFTLLGDSTDAAAEAREDGDGDRNVAGEARTHPRRVARSAKELQQDVNRTSCRSSRPISIGTIISRRPISRSPGDINVGQPDFFKAANDVFKTVSLDDWKTYLRWHLMHGEAGALSSDFVNENFNFFEKTLTGVEANQAALEARRRRDRWRIGRSPR